MKKRAPIINLTRNVDQIVSLSRNMKRDKGTMRFSTFDGKKRTLSLDNLFTKRELSLKCLKTATDPSQKYFCTFERAFDLGQLVQYFSWNNATINCNLDLGALGAPRHNEQLSALNTIEVEEARFIVSESYTTTSIGFQVEYNHLTMGTIIDFTVDSNGITPTKIFGMNIPMADDTIEVFYSTPQEGQVTFNLAASLIEKHSRRI